MFCCSAFAKNASHFNHWQPGHDAKPLTYQFSSSSAQMHRHGSTSNAFPENSSHTNRGSTPAIAAIVQSDFLHTMAHAK